MTAAAARGPSGLEGPRGRAVVRGVEVDAVGPQPRPPHQPGAGGADPAGRAGDDGNGPLRGAWRHASSACATTAARLSVPPAGAPRRNVRQTISAARRASTPGMMRLPQLRYHSLKTRPG